MSYPSTNERNRAIAARVIKAFKDIGVTRRIDIANAIGVHKQYIQDWKSGKGSVDKWLSKISDLTGKPLDYFLRINEAVPDSPSVKDNSNNDIQGSDEPGCDYLRALRDPYKGMAMAMLEALYDKQLKETPHGEDQFAEVSMPYMRGPGSKEEIDDVQNHARSQHLKSGTVDEKIVQKALKEARERK